MSTVKNTANGLSISMIGIQIAAQIFMKANIQKLFKLFLNMQIQQGLPIF